MNTNTFDEMLEKFSNSKATYTPTEQEDDSVWYAYWYYIDNDDGRKYTYGIAEESVDKLFPSEYGNADYEKRFSKKAAEQLIVEWKAEHKQEER